MVFSYDIFCRMTCIIDCCQSIDFLYCAAFLDPALLHVVFNLVINFLKSILHVHSFIHLLSRHVIRKIMSSLLIIIAKVNSFNTIPDCSVRAYFVINSRLIIIL